MRRVPMHASLVYCALLAVCAVTAAAGTPQPAGISLGGAAPDFKLKNLSGEEVALSQKLAGGPVLIDFWATWCKPCLRALPGTEELHKKYADRGLTVLTVNVDSPRSSAKVRSYVKSKGYSFEVLLDANSEMMRLYHFKSIPQVFLVDADGTIAYSHLGYAPGNERRLAEEIEKLLDAGAGEESGADETDQS
ncbi:MAG: TlpA family protein disulfide reductase [Candidatus Eisenbacteria bacterium]|nr:TlpA family protein disulfide reductase [Candidatus Eisenbacteria bacterium]